MHTSAASTGANLVGVPHKLHPGLARGIGQPNLETESGGGGGKGEGAQANLEVGCRWGGQGTNLEAGWGMVCQASLEVGWV